MYLRIEIELTTLDGDYEIMKKYTIILDTAELTDTEFFQYRNKHNISADIVNADYMEVKYTALDYQTLADMYYKFFDCGDDESNIEALYTMTLEEC